MPSGAHARENSHCTGANKILWKVQYIRIVYGRCVAAFKTHVGQFLGGSKAIFFIAFSLKVWSCANRSTFRVLVNAASGCNRCFCR